MQNSYHQLSKIVFEGVKKNFGLDFCKIWGKFEPKGDEKQKIFERNSEGKCKGLWECAVILILLEILWKKYNENIIFYCNLIENKNILKKSREKKC